MTTPRRGLLFHFTHIVNLPSIVTGGLYCDSDVTDSHQSVREVGHRDIKAQRRARRVPLPPGGVVADYVPFYFAARSPMLYVISRRSVPTYTEGQEELVYLVTNVEAVTEHGLRFVFTDRNAALGYAQYGNDPQLLNDYVDWALMQARMWADTAEEPDRKERRMAEFLAHRHVPWALITTVAAKNEQVAERAQSLLDSLGATTPVRVKPGWYF